MNKRLARATTVAVAVSAFGLGGAGVANAQAIVCDSSDNTVTLSNLASSQRVTHATALENYTGGSVTRTVSASRQTTLSAGITVTTSVSSQAGAIFAKLSASVGVTVAADGSTTSGTAESVTYTMPKNDRYIFFAGDKYWTATYVQGHCGGGGTSYTESKGSIHSYAIYTEGGVGCSVSPPASTLSYSAKKYC